MYGRKTEHRGQLNIWGWAPGRGALCLTYGGSLCFEASASGAEKACSGLFSLAESWDFSEAAPYTDCRWRQQVCQSMQHAACTKKEKGRKPLNEGCPRILKPTQLSSLHIYEAETSGSFWKGLKPLSPCTVKHQSTNKILCFQPQDPGTGLWPCRDTLRKACCFHNPCYLWQSLRPTVGPRAFVPEETSVLSSENTCQNSEVVKQRAFPKAVSTSHSLELRPWKFSTAA